MPRLGSKTVLKTGTAVAGLALLSFAAGVWYQGSSDSARADKQVGTQVLRYICPMHPQYVSDKPGTAPCCGMRLEPVYAEDESAPSQTLPSGTVRVSPEKQQLLGVRVTGVDRTAASQTLRVPGRVEADERLIYRLNAGLDGWVREVYSDTTGSIVRRNDRLATLYSPMYRAAQQSYLVALGHLQTATEHLKESPDQIAAVRRSLELAKDGLRNLGVAEIQIEEIGRTQQQTEDIHLISPVTGFVIARNVSKGQRFTNGEELYRIADLSRVWILADLFEREAQYVKAGQIALVSYQGKRFEARVSDVLPQFDPDSRTLKVRLELENRDFRLRPGMYVDVSFVVEPPPAVTVPYDSIIDSGLRKIVYVDRGAGYFEPRVVETGWQMGERVEIKRGLEIGERVAVEGTFLLDSESRMKAAAGVQSPAKDPICRMDVDRAKAKAAGRTSEYKDKTYYFCADQCKKEFDKDPAKWAVKD